MWHSSRRSRLNLEARTPDDLGWLFYTSGTTGRPKGAMISHRNMAAMCACYFMDMDGIDPGDCIIHAAPMSHGSGIYGLPHVAAAAKQVIPESGGFEPGEIFALLRAHWGATLFAAPTMVHRLTESPEAGLRRYRQPQDHRLWRRAHVSRGPEEGAEAFRQQARAGLRPGRKPDDHHRAFAGAPCRDRPPPVRGAPRLRRHGPVPRRGAGRRRRGPYPCPRASWARCWCGAIR